MALASVYARVWALDKATRCCLVEENAEAWAANAWIGPARGTLGGAAYMNRSAGELRLTDAAPGQSGFVYWQVNPGNTFVLNVQFRTGRGTALWVSTYASRPSSTYPYTTAPYELRVAVSAESQAVTMCVFGEVRTVPWPSNGTNESWCTLTIVMTPGRAQLVVGSSVCESFAFSQATTDEFRRARPELCVTVGAINSSATSLHALKEVMLWTSDRSVVGRDSRSLAVNEVEYPTYTLVRRGSPPRDAVTFGVQLNQGPVFGGFCHSWAHGCVPCKIMPSSSMGSGYAAVYTGAAVPGAASISGRPTVFTSLFFFYIVPKPGYWAVRKRVMATASDTNPVAPATAVYVRAHRDEANNPQLPVYLVAQEVWLQQACTFGRFERTATGGTGETELFGPIPLTYDGSWDYVCIMPCSTKRRYVVLPKGTAVTDTSNATWDSNQTWTNVVDANEIATSMEGKTGVSCVHFQQDTGVVVYLKGSPWPLRTSGVSTWNAVVRAEDLEAAKPGGDVTGASYRTTDYVDSTRNLVWRWLDGWGWYLNIRRT